MGMLFRCFSYRFARERYCPSQLIFLLIPSFWTQEAGTVRCAYAFRHNDPHQCVVGSIAFYLYLQFDVEMEPWPEFGSVDRTWHSIKLLRHRSDPYKQLGYPVQLK